MRKGRNGLDPNTHNNRLTIGDTPLDTTGIIGQVIPTAILTMTQNIVYLRARSTRRSKAGPYFHSFDRWDTHHSHAQASTQAAIPLAEASQAHRYAKAHYLECSTAGIAAPFAFQNTCNH